MAKKIGFSQIPHGFSKRVHELKGVRLAVWLVHRCMEGKAGESYPTLKQLEDYTGYEEWAVKHARQWLRANGWLVTVERRMGNGKFKVPTEHTDIPQKVENTTVGKPNRGGVEKPTMDGLGFPTVGKSHKKEDPSDGASLEVDPPKVNPQEVGNERVEANYAFGDDAANTTNTNLEQAWKEMTPEAKQAVHDLGNRIGSELDDSDWDIFDALKIRNRFGSYLGSEWDGPWGDDVKTLLKIFKSPRWKGAEKTVASLAFRFSSPNYGSGKTLAEIFTKVRAGRLRTQGQAAPENEENDLPSRGPKKFEMEVEEV